MKNLIIPIAAALCGAAVGFGVVYLLGSFYEVSFDIAEWIEQTRLTVALFGTMLMFAGAAIFGGMAYEVTTAKP